MDPSCEYSRSCATIFPTHREKFYVCEYLKFHSVHWFWHNINFVRKKLIAILEHAYKRKYFK